MDIPVYGVSKYPQKLRDAPASVTVISREEIRRYGYRTLADILRSVPGFFLTNDRNYEYLGIRGFNRPGDVNTRFLLLLDGHRLNDPIYQMAPIGRDFPVDVDLIERVEVIRGPSFALYGSGAFLAVINVITRRGADLRRGEVSAAAGSYGAWQGRATVGHKWPKGAEVLLSGTYFNSPGPDRVFFPDLARPATNQGFAAGCDYEKNYNFFAKASYGDFTLTGVYSSRTKGIPTGVYETAFNDSRNKSIDALGFLDVKFQRALPRDFGLLARLGYTWNAYDGHYWYDTGAGPWARLLNRDVGRSHWLLGEIQVTKRLWDRHMLIAGVEWQQYLKLYQLNYDYYPPLQILSDTRRGSLWAGYAQGEFVLRPDLRLFAGVRYDYYSTCGGAVNPRAAVVFQPFAPTTLKLLYNEGFRAPSYSELYYQDGGYTAKANPALQPEKIRALELIWEQRLARSWWLKTSGFYYCIHNLISQVTDPKDGLAVYENLLRVGVTGLEAELGGRWRGLEGRLSYSLQEVWDQHTGRTLPNCPRHLGKVNLMFPLYSHHFLGGLEVLLMSPRRTLSGGEVNTSAIVNLTLLGRQLWPGVELSASVYNLFNQKYFDPASVDHLSSGLRRLPQEGLTFRLKATWAF